jgi:putative ABC transport system permease protein
MRKDITYDDALAIADLPTVEGATPQLVVGSFAPFGTSPVVKYKGMEANRPLVMGVWPNYDRLRNVFIQYGRFFTQAEEQHKAQVAVIGAGVAETLYGALDPIDREIEIEGEVFRVIGVMEKAPGGLFGGEAVEDRQLIVPFETLKSKHPEIEDITVIVKGKAKLFGAMTDEVTELMRRRRGVPVNKPNNFGLTTPEGIFDILNQIAYGASVIVVPLSGAGLLVGGIGVMNIMLVSVTERTKEIGVRRAIGAKKADIIWQFLTEAVTLTGTGGLIGIFVGWLISLVLKMLAPTLPSTIPLWSVITGIVVSCSVGLFFGIWPAMKAARLDPIEALRYE